MVNTYLYTGPLPLGSVVAHNCGAAGLLFSKVNPDRLPVACEGGGDYALTLSPLGTV